MAKRSIRDIENIWSNVEGVKKLSDRVIGFGPFGLGLDALLTWIPVVGTVYTVGTGGWLILQAVRAKASPATLARMAAYMAIDRALADVRSKNCGAVPAHLRDAHYKGAAKLGHGTAYIYPHSYPGHFTPQQYLPDEMRGAHYYEPTENGEEKRLQEYLGRCWPERWGYLVWA